VRTCAVWLHQHTAEENLDRTAARKDDEYCALYVVLRLPLLLLANFNSIS